MGRLPRALRARSGSKDLPGHPWVCLRCAGCGQRRRNGASMPSLIVCAHVCNPGWNEVLTHMDPYGWGYYGIAFGLGLSVVGAAWGIWLTGSSLVAASVKAPRIRSKNLIRCVWGGDGTVSSSLSPLRSRTYAPPSPACLCALVQRNAALFFVRRRRYTGSFWPSFYSAR